MKHEITLTVNGRERSLTVESHRTLLELIRDELKLFGARESCGMSLCGACTVLVDGLPVSSCSLPGGACERPDHHDDRGPGQPGSSSTRCSKPLSTTAAFSAPSAPRA